MDIAHEPSKLTGPELASIKQRIEAQGIVFKVRVVGSQMSSEISSAKRNRAKQRSEGINENESNL